MSDSLEKAAIQDSFKAFPSLHFLQGCSLATSSMSAASSSSCLGPFGAGTPWSKEGCKHFPPTSNAGIPDTLGVGSAGTNPLSAMDHSWVVADIPRMVAKGTLLVRSCRGYRSAPQDLGRQACTATPLKASMKVWQSHPSSTFTSHSNASILSL